MIVTSKYIELKAPFKNRQQTHLVKVRNDLEKSVAFKVKTTAPKLYCVRPNSGVLKKGEEGEITIIFQGLSEEPSIGSKCKDKFLIVSVPIGNEVEEFDGKLVSTEWDKLVSEAGGNTQDVKLKVVYNFDSPMNTITEEEHSVAEVTPAVAPAVPAVPAVPAKVSEPVAVPSKVSEPVAVPSKAVSSAPAEKSSISGVEVKNGSTTVKSGGVNVYLIAALVLLLAFIASRVM